MSRDFYSYDPQGTRDAAPHVPRRHREPELSGTRSAEDQVMLPRVAAKRRNHRSGMF